MIDLYTWRTPNGRKASIMLEEVGLPYRVVPVDIGKGEQFEPDFLKISPNNKIPAIVDRDEAVSLMESGAILIYLAVDRAPPPTRDGPGRLPAPASLVPAGRRAPGGAARLSRTRGNLPHSHPGVAAANVAARRATAVRLP